MSYFFDLTPKAVEIPESRGGFFSGFLNSADQRLQKNEARRAEEGQWRDTVNAFPGTPGGITREQMFALGRDPALRPYAVELLTGRMKPQQFSNTASSYAPVPLPMPRPQPPAFAPSRMATAADYQTMPGGAGYADPYAGLGGWRR